MSSHAERQFKKIPKAVAIRLKPVILALGDDPRPASSLKMSGEQNAWRMRVGDYRIVYEIHDKTVLVLVVDIGHRKEVYR